MKNSILVFRTSVGKDKDIGRLGAHLDQLISPGGRWIFDLEDCDRILKVVNPKHPPEWVIKTLDKEGFLCEEL